MKTTKWIPLKNYYHGYDEYIVLARRNYKTGMIYFVSKKVTMNKSINIPLNIEKQWEKLMSRNQ